MTEKEDLPMPTNEKKQMFDISQDLKNAGFVYREPDKNHPKYKLVQEICNANNRECSAIQSSTAETIQKE